MSWVKLNKLSSAPIDKFKNIFFLSLSNMKFKFSYWIFLWFILFIAGIISYNPFFALCIALFSNIYVLLLLFNKNYIYKAVLYFITIILIKVIPLLILIYYNQVSVEYTDIVFLIILGFIYLVFIKIIQKKSIFNIYDETNNNEIKTPIMSLLDYIIKLNYNTFY
jgi:hypothetical protein